MNAAPRPFYCLERIAVPVPEVDSVLKKKKSFSLSGSESRSVTAVLTALRRMSQKYGVRAWIGFLWLIVCKHGSELLGSTQSAEYLD